MLKEMGNQNATAIPEEEKAANEVHGNQCSENTTEENRTLKDEKISTNDGIQEAGNHEDQTLDHTKEQDEYSEGRGVNSMEPITNETQGIENQASAIKDDDDDDDDEEYQETEDTNLNTNAEDSHESDALVTLDAKTDDHVHENIKENLSLHANEESNGTSSRIGEFSIQGTDDEVSETEEEKVIDAVDNSDQKSSTNSKNLEMEFVNDGDNCSSASHDEEDESIGLTKEDEAIKASIEEVIEEHETTDQIEVVKSVMNTSALIEKLDHDTNNPASEEDDAEKLYEFGGKSEEEKDQESSSHVADFKDLEMVDSKDTNSKEDDETEHFLEFVGNSEEEKDAGKISKQDPGSSSSDASDFKDLEVVEAKPSPTSENSTISDNHSTQLQIQKSPSFNFEFMNLVTKTEEVGQTPLLYNNNNNKAPMRSLSTPVNARFSTENVNHGSADQERTINIVDCDQNSTKDQEEETHLLKPQKIQQQVELCKGNGIEIPLQQRPREQKRSKSSRNSGSHFFSSCICCSGVQELADP